MASQDSAVVLVLTKMGRASPEQIHVVRVNNRKFNPKATALETAMPITVDLPHLIKEIRVLVIEDGQTLTRGGMSFGVSVLAAKQQGAGELVDPIALQSDDPIDFRPVSPYWQHAPSHGFGAAQVRELEETINRVPCDVNLVATTVDLGKIISIKQSTCRVIYRLEKQGALGFRGVGRASF